MMMPSNDLIDLVDELNCKINDQHYSEAEGLFCPFEAHFSGEYQGIFFMSINLWVSEDSEESCMEEVRKTVLQQAREWISSISKIKL